MMEEITKFGTPTTKTSMPIDSPHASGWKGVLLEHAITLPSSNTVTHLAKLSIPLKYARK
jgi:hypothetical protein